MKHTRNAAIAGFRTLAVTLAILGAAGAALATAPESDIAVRVDIKGEVVNVDVNLVIPASPREVWDVITDFEHLPNFISNIKSSKVLSRDGNVVRVAQAGRAGVGLFSFEFQSEREITLTPPEKFESRMISGNMKRFFGVTRLELAEGKTKLVYRSEAVPDTWLPPSMGRSFIENETREHYQEIRKEVLKRKSDAAAK